MSVTTFPMGYLSTNCYIVSSGSDAVMVDPGGTLENGLAAALEHLARHNLILRAIVLTHLHFDHIYGVAAVQRAYPGLNAYANMADMVVLESPYAGGEMFGLPKTEPFTPTPISEGPISFGAVKGSIRFTPGHTPGGLALYLPEEHAVLSGDTLFYRSLGRTDLLGGNATQLLASVMDQLFSLPEDTTVYPGHGPETEIGYEKKHNPYVFA